MLSVGVRSIPAWWAKPNRTKPNNTAVIIVEGIIGTLPVILVFVLVFVFFVLLLCL
jgi:hypothetical protein